MDYCTPQCLVCAQTSANDASTEGVSGSGACLRVCSAKHAQEIHRNPPYNAHHCGEKGDAAKDDDTTILSLKLILPIIVGKQEVCLSKSWVLVCAACDGVRCALCCCVRRRRSSVLFMCMQIQIRLKVLLKIRPMT